MVRLATGEKSEAIAKRMKTARQRQLDRQGKLNNELNSNQITLSPTIAGLIEKASIQLRLSARGITRLLRVAQTIADLAGEDGINTTCVTEALTFRKR